MAREGFFKIHRCLFEHPIWLNSSAEQKVILITLIEMANHSDNTWEWKGEEYTVKRGQMVTSIDSIREECGKGITTQNVRTALKRFEKLGFLTNESTKTGRLVTIEKYNKWQGSDSEPNKEDNKDLTKTSQRPNKDLTPNKNDKNDKNDKKNNIIRHKYGRYDNVLLSDTDYEKLVDEFPMDYQDRIEALSEYMKYKGKSYKDHLATIRSWARREQKQQKAEQKGRNDWINEL